MVSGISLTVEKWSFNKNAKVCSYRCRICMLPHNTLAWPYLSIVTDGGLIAPGVSFLLIIAHPSWIILDSQAIQKARHIDFLIMSVNGKLSKFLNPFKSQGLFRSDKRRHHVDDGDVFVLRHFSVTTFLCCKFVLSEEAKELKGLSPLTFLNIFYTVGEGERALCLIVYRW